VVHGKAVVISGTSNNLENQCSAPLNIVVPLKQVASGRVRKAHKVIRISGTTSLNSKDADSLKLECRPSTCGNGIIETDHEICDDHNRSNGDGCNQACQVEPGFVCSGQPSVCVWLGLTPSSTPTVTVTPTRTGSAAPTGTPTTTPTLGPSPTPMPSVSPTATTAGGVPLGNRTFTLGPASAYYSSFLPTLAVGTPAGQMVLAAGSVDGSGHASVTVTGPFYISIAMPLAGMTICSKIESCTGELYCNGGTNVDNTETLDSLAAGLTCVQDGTHNCPDLPTSVCCSNACEGVSVGSGNPVVSATGVNSTDSGAGALLLTCTQRNVTPQKASGVDCSTQDYSAAPAFTQVYTTGSSTAIVRNHCAGLPSSAGNNATVVPQFTKTGEDFDCTNWTLATGPGAFAFSTPAEEPSTLTPSDGSQAGVFSGH
jgi:cysteine-rich repeat protein